MVLKYKKKTTFLLFVLFILMVSLAPIANSDSHLPIGLQKIIDYNNKATQDFAIKISFFIAFVAGMLTVLSPCILPLLPVYFSYTFKEKKNITKMTLVFFIGFSLTFVTMGVIAGLIGEQVLSVVQNNVLVTIAGIGIIILGVMIIFGKGFSSFIRPQRKFSNDISGVFLFGIFFALGWTACLGPILAGILGIGAVLHNTGYSALLLFSYSLGYFVPLFVLSIFYDKTNFSNSILLKGKMLTLPLGKRKLHVHSTNLLSGMLFIIVGSLIVIFQGTAFVNTWDIFRTKQLFFNAQRALFSFEYTNIAGIIIFILLFVVIISTLKKRK